MIVTELRRFFIALGYFTRVPVPAWVGWAPDELNRAARYFPLIGLLIGAASAGVLWLAGMLWTAPVAIVLAMLCSLLLTGAFHEDGLADSADGFGGGYSPARVLEIMKDSRIGSFGAVALVIVMLGKFSALWTLGGQAWLALIVVHPLSRLAALGLMRWLPYVRDDESARAKPVAQGMTSAELAIGSLAGLLPMLLAVAWHAIPAAQAGAALLGTLAGAMWCARYFRKRIGGYTGDCLGATQQLCELMAYLALGARLV